MNNIELDFEIRRKIFHLCAIIFPIIYLYFSKVQMCVILFLISSVVLYLDIFRYYDNRIKGVVERFFGKFMRASEKEHKLALSGSGYMALGLFVTGLFFDKGLAITSWIILIISDFVAAIIGTKIGTPLFNGKSYEGAIAFFISTIFISIMSHFIIGFNTGFFVIIISSFLTTLAEFFSKELNVNDNLSIPVVYSLSTVILVFILY